MKIHTSYTNDQVEKICNDADFLWRMHPDARLMTNKILTEPSEKNLDPLNHHMDARQLLVALLVKILQISDPQDKIFYSSLLEEQLLDMNNLGPCPQGRTIRLWQLFQTLQD
jgi:hypothetical protein